MFKSLSKNVFIGILADKKQQMMARIRAIRTYSETLCRPLSIEDHVVQTMPEVSPPKWHLAHTSWFFEEFVCVPFLDSYKKYSAEYGKLFNSYYETYGTPFPRHLRGTLSRPTVDEILNYRVHVTNAVLRTVEILKEENWHRVISIIELGLNHEQQHQELLLADIKYNFYSNPLKPAYIEENIEHEELSVGKAKAMEWKSFGETIASIGHGVHEKDFAFDNEKPLHKHLVLPFRIADRCVTNGEYLSFINDHGYENPKWWLADGWREVEKHGWKNPLYWEKQGSNWRIFTLGGMQFLDLQKPVSHLSYYEADAFARWSNRRLPTEFEWEVAMSGLTIQVSDIWQWTKSAYEAYPGYKNYGGSLGEYNAKFMCGQFVLRGGSWATSRGHIRTTYRNFFPPNARWQFTGVRLADDI